MKIQGSKFYYYGWFLLIILIFSMGVIVFLDLFERGKRDAAIAISVWNGLFTACIFFLIGKYVFVEEREDKSFLIGNFFFTKVAYPGQVKIKRILLPNLYKIKLDNEVYWFMAINRLG